MFKITLVLLAIASFSLSVPHPLHHLLNNPAIHYNQTVSDDFQAGFTAMKGLVDKVSTTLTKNDSQQYKFLITKCSEITAGLNKLRETLVGYNLSITNTSKLCPPITSFNRTELRRYIIYTESNEQAAVSYLATCLSCSFVATDVLQIQNLTNSYIQHLNTTLDGYYCNPSKVSKEKPTGIVNLNNSYFKNNLKAKNWYYGSTTASDYKIYLFKRASSYNLTNCPIETPFVQDQQQTCFNCPEGSIFNLGLQKCDTCKPNEILNIKSGGCDSCLGEKKFINGALVCQLCILAQGQLFNETNGKCYTCGSDSYLDADKLACIKINCSGNTPRFNKTNKQCQLCGPSEIVDSHDVTKCIKTNFIGMCPPSTPRYDFDTKQCIPCQNNTIYNDNTNQCDQNNTSQPKAHLTHVSSLHLDTIQCPPEKPILNPTTNLCQPCPIHQVYILKLNRCIPISIVCNEDQFYSTKTFECLAKYMNCKESQYYSKEKKSCQPKSDRCLGNERYNQEKNTCEKMILCGGRQVYNQKLRICQDIAINCLEDERLTVVYGSIEPEYRCMKLPRVTSPYISNLIYLDDFTKYEDQYIRKRFNYPNAKDCPLDKPFYQSKQSLCISCPKETPYFDILNDKCISCPEGQSYEPTHHKCMTINFTTVSSSINRMGI